MRRLGVTAVALVAAVLVVMCGGGVLCDDGGGGLGDPYRLLGVRRDAPLQEIRRAYKRLAKEWHPDKSDDPRAEGRFVEMKQAYEILSDPDRRKLYDHRGITDEDSARQRRSDRFPGADPFDGLFSGGGGDRFQRDHDATAFHRMSVTGRQFENSLLPRSRLVPHLVLFYTDWCFPCLQAAPQWRRLVDALEPLGVALATAHAGREASLARRLGVGAALPALVLLLDGSAHLLRPDGHQPVAGVHQVVEFLRARLPRRLVPAVTDATVDGFLAGWPDNRVRGLVFSGGSGSGGGGLRLRYLVAAYRFRERVAFGQVRVGPDADGAAAGVARRYGVSGDADTVLLFNEDSARPMASVSMREIPGRTLRHVVGGNRYLALPRLSSQAVLEELCPAEWSRPRKRLCVVLVTEDTAEHDGPRLAMRRYAGESRHAAGGGGQERRVRFAYLYRERQAEFVGSLAAAAAAAAVGGEPRVVIIWRRDARRVKYEWPAEVAGGGRRWWPDGDNETRRLLDETIARLLRPSEALGFEAADVAELLDEHARGPLARIVARLLAAADAACDGLTRDQLLPALSVAATVALVVGAGCLAAHLARLEEEGVRRGRCGGGGGATAAPAPQPHRELHLHELRAEKYNGLVRLLKPGCRALVLLVDARSRRRLVAAFHRTVWPYRRNRTLVFAHMSVERGLLWYRELLELSLPEPRALTDINPRNCVGTVLALNGHRKYFCMFHAKHDEAAATAGGGRRRRPQPPPSTTTSRDAELGAFVGFESGGDDDTSGDEERAAEAPLLEAGLLDALPNWLDRLFEGTTRRYYINYWPDFPTK